MNDFHCWRSVCVRVHALTVCVFVDVTLSLTHTRTHTALLYHAGHQTTDGPHQHKHTQRVWTTFLGQSWEKTERVWGITLMKYCKHWKTDGENKQRQTWKIYEMNFDSARLHWPMSGSLPRGSTWRLWAVAVLYPVSVRKFKKCRVPSIHSFGLTFYIFNEWSESLVRFNLKIWTSQNIIKHTPTQIHKRAKTNTDLV